jgi:phosphate transport system substrate-binding protein
MMNKKWLVLLIIALMAAWTTAAWSAEIKLFGAASTADRLIMPNKAAVEKKTGVALVVAPSNAAKGLVDLVDGKCDAALSAASLETTVQAAKTLGRDIDASKLTITVVASDEIVFIVHPSNKVTRLTWEQLRDIHTGKIRNWKEVGGKDSVIIVFTDAASSATRGLIKQSVMGGKEYSPEAKALDAVKKVNDMVAVTPDGIGGLGKGFVTPGEVKIIESKKVERPLGFITIGQPRGDMKKVIEAFRAEANKK